ncbi:23S rRNA (adenine2030-N6)-methyltransferase [Treponema bryantii]|uniref:Ribosomal RNA large subunit methyltransferase J n=1 Tax=Treponema bryantii TaxID=163 RepID=A0A1I3M8X8_9SPIR|nr:23S rRNA (adenine(2030)-N(6))-methyltransferase RlmJ [Treponema bryantii]SFI93428.1 23S rRNA (adenine2030-N6)-methyltransferase [Treponema bryantii]
MLSYQHIFHAGNHADILKHSVLIQVLDSLNKKDKPYTFFDTHSGSGLYDLTDNRSLKTGEAQKGIEVISKLGGELPPALTRYLDFVSAYLKDERYPGSPEIERSLMREQDNLILSELHPQEIENLRNNMKAPLYNKENNPEVQVHNRSGWEMLKALTPPATKRGAVLVDPSYEEISDYQLAADTICAVHKKWTNGIIMLWYPLLAHREGEIEAMLDRITEGARALNQNIEIADLRLEVFDKDAHKEVSLDEFRASEGKNPPRLYGSGMLVLNTPWKLVEETQSVIDYVKSVI